MVLEKQDSGVCLSVEPASPTAEDKSLFQWSKEGKGTRSSDRGALFGSADGLERLRSTGKEFGSSREKEGGMDGEERLTYSIDASRMRQSETLPNLSDGRLDGNYDEEVNEGWIEENERPQTRCHHYLLSPEQEFEDGPRICQLCRKKQERLKALRRAIGDDHGSEGSSWSSEVLNSCKIVISGDTRSQSTESPRSLPPSSPADSDRGSFDLSASSATTNRKHNDSRHSQSSNSQHRLSSRSPTGYSMTPDRHKGQLSPRDSPGGQQQQQQQELLQKLQGALSKVSPRIFKSTKAERPLSAVGSQDQKILALMWAKKEEEERQRALRELSHRQWEEEMRSARDSPITSNRGSSFRRRRHTADPSSTRKKDKSAREATNEENGIGSDPQTPCSAHGLSSQHLNKFHDERDVDAVGAVGSENLDKGKRTLTKSQLDLRAQKLKEKQIQAMERKKSVEQRLEQQRREMEEHLLQLKKKQEQDLQRANSVRMSREQQQMLRAKLKNLEAQQKQEKINQMKRQSMMDLTQKQEEIRNKLSQAELKAQQMKHEDARRRRDDLERRIEQSRMRQDQIESEQRQWKEELLKYQKWKDYQADGLAKENLAKKREAACAERIQKEKLQRENMKRLLNQEEEWLNEVESSIAIKDARTRTVQKEKEEQIQKNRAMASAYQRMREELKTHYSMNDLDQVAQKVVLENRLASRPRGGSSSNPSQGHLLAPPSHNSTIQFGEEI